MSTIELTPGCTTISQLIKAVENQGCVIQLNRSCKAQVQKSAAVVEAVANGDTAVYGVNTGSGKLSSIRIASEDSATLQRNLILSHCAGVGDVCDAQIVRLMMILKLLSLGRGASGVRWELVAAIEDLLKFRYRAACAVSRLRWCIR